MTPKWQARQTLEKFLVGSTLLLLIFVIGLAFWIQPLAEQQAIDKNRSMIIYLTIISCCGIVAIYSRLKALNERVKQLEKQAGTRPPSVTPKEGDPAVNPDDHLRKLHISQFER